MSELNYNRFLDEFKFEDFERKRQLLVGTFVRIDAPKGLPIRTDTWGVEATIGNHRFEFVFAWNGISKRFSLNIRRDGVRIWKHYPIADERLDLPNFLPDNKFQPHAALVIMSAGDDETPMTPETMNSGDHYILIALGTYIRLAKEGRISGGDLLS